MSPTLAIDFGSSRTKIACLCPETGKPKMVELGHEIRAVMPSVFYIPQSGPVLVGDEAVQMADEDPAGIVVDIKRELQRPGKIRCGEGRPAYLRSELVSILFSEIRRRCDEEVFHNGSIDSCMLTVPVCFSEPQRQKLRHAAENAGFTHVRLLEEPIAAAMHWLSGAGKSVSDHVIVVDIGGGTTDLAALKLCGSTYEVIPDLPPCGFAAGGNDIDNDLRRMIAKEGECTDEEAGALLMKLRQVKERMPKMDRDVFTINLAGRTRTIPRNVVELAVQSLVAKTCAEAARFLNDFQEVTGRTDTPVLLAGGGSKLAGMKEALAEVAGEDRVFIWNDAEYAIALGAALAGNPNRATIPRTSLQGKSADPEPKVAFQLEVEPRVDPKPTEPKLPPKPITVSSRAGTAPENGRLTLLAALETILCNEICPGDERKNVTANMVIACELEAKRGNNRAQALIAFCHIDGNQVAQDFDEGAKLARLSADQGDALGQYLMGLCFLFGTGVPQADGEAVRWLQFSAEQGNAQAQWRLGNCCMDGKGGPIDQEKGAKWLQLAADKGVSMAQADLGVCFVRGEGVAQDLDSAVKWFRLSADAGNVSGYFNLGVCYRDGLGVTKNDGEAFKWFQLASNLGHAMAQCDLGFCCLNGLGTRKSQGDAFQWFRSSAEGGYAEGQYQYGCFYLNGTGVLEDVSLAKKWFQLAANQGSDNAKKAINLIKKNKKKEEDNKDRIYGCGCLIIIVIILIITIRACS